MKKETINNTKLGLFVIVASILFLIGVYSIGNRQNLFGSTFILTSYFRDVQGLQTGNNVRYSGINVGAIDEISIVNDTMVRVDMRIDKEIQAFIKKDALARINTDGLVGNKVVNIEPGKGLREGVDNNDVIQSYQGVNTQNMLSTVENTNNNIAKLSDHLVQITSQILDSSGSINQLVTDKRMATDISQILNRMNRISVEIYDITKMIKSIVVDINEGNGNIGYLLKDTILKTQIQDLVVAVDKKLIDDTDPIIDNLNTSTKDILSLTNRLDSLVNQIDLNDGFLGMILSDTTSTEDIKLIIQNINEGTLKFNESMEALQHNFLLRGYFKKQKKEKAKLAEKNNE